MIIILLNFINLLFILILGRESQKNLRELEKLKKDLGKEEKMRKKEEIACFRNRNLFIINTFLVIGLCIVVVISVEVILEIATGGNLLFYI